MEHEEHRYDGWNNHWNHSGKTFHNLNTSLNCNLNTMVKMAVSHICPYCMMKMTHTKMMMTHMKNKKNPFLVLNVAPIV